MSRTRLEIGEASNDGKGDLLPVAATIIEDFFIELCMFMSGGVSEVDLGNALPIVRGGTGARTEKELANVLLTYGSRNFMPVVCKHVPIALCTVAYGAPPKTTKFPSVTGAITFIRNGVGSYKVSVFDPMVKIEGGYVYIRPDNLGNQRYGVEVSYSGSDINLTVSPIVFDSTSGLYRLDDSINVDLPDDTYLSFLLVNTMSTLI